MFFDNLFFPLKIENNSNFQLSELYNLKDVFQIGSTEDYNALSGAVSFVKDYYSGDIQAGYMTYYNKSAVSWSVVPEHNYGINACIYSGSETYEETIDILTNKVRIYLNDHQITRYTNTHQPKLVCITTSTDGYENNFVTKEELMSVGLTIRYENRQ